MKEVNEMPENGQFVGVWEFNDHIWCDTYLIEYGVLYVRNSETDDFVDSPYSADWLAQEDNMKYFIYGEE